MDERDEGEKGERWGGWAGRGAGRSLEKHRCVGREEPRSGNRMCASACVSSHYVGRGCRGGACPSGGPRTPSPEAWGAMCAGRWVVSNDIMMIAV